MNLKIILVASRVLDITNLGPSHVIYFLSIDLFVKGMNFKKKNIFHETPF